VESGQSFPWPILPENSAVRSKRYLAAITLAVTLAASAVSARVVIIQVFEGSNTLFPEAGITIDRSGNIFGTSAYYGDSKNCTIGCGEIFETSPLGHGQWTTTALYSFQNGSDGAYPSSPLALDESGNLYGSILAGNISQVYRLAPQGGSWNFSLLSVFPRGTTVNTSAPLLYDNNSLLGLAWNGQGTVFQVTEPQGGGLPWSLSTLFTFPSGVRPDWIASDSGMQNVYVSTSEGNGTVVQLVPGQPWSENVLYSFKGDTDGYDPTFVMVGADGSVYGTASGGRHRKKVGFGGIVFRLSPPANFGEAWTKTTLYNISGWPPVSLTAAPNGALVGVVFGEEDGGAGYVFQLTPPQGSGKNSWTYQKLGAFRRSVSCNPLNAQYGKDHALYGVLNGICDSVAGIFEIK
jgi:hypothetical protein